MKIKTCLCAAIIFLCCGVVCANQLKGNPYAVSRMKFYETDADFASGVFTRTRLQKGEGVLYQRGGWDAPTSGSYTSAPFESPFTLTEILPSWNVDCPTSAGIAVWMSVSEDGRAWSQWLYLGREGWTPPLWKKPLRDKGALVDIDYLILNKPFRFFKWRMEFYSQTLEAEVRLKLFAVCYGNSSGDEQIYKKFYQKPPEPKDWARRLDVPWRSQLAADQNVPREMRGSICCPTSISMILEYYKHKLQTKAVCDLCFDSDYEIWGVWPRAAQTLYRFGLRSYVMQIRTLEEIKPFIAGGVPLIISIRAEKGELASAPYRESDGHVLIISGMEKDGRIWVNDPYNPDGGEGQRLWSREDIEKAFIGAGGVAIIAEPVAE